jgi:hypothetical protein
MSDSDVNLPEPPADKLSSDPSGQGIADLVNELQKVDINAPDATLNATTISDNNGGRIDLTEKNKLPKRKMQW